jgi:hypothetical protein
LCRLAEETLGEIGFSFHSRAFGNANISCPGSPLRKPVAGDADCMCIQAFNIEPPCKA